MLWLTAPAAVTAVTIPNTSPGPVLGSSLGVVGVVGVVGVTGLTGLPDSNLTGAAHLSLSTNWYLPLTLTLTATLAI